MLGILMLLGLVLHTWVWFQIGRAQANAEWTLRSKPLNRTAHHCGGKFYYVIPEPELVREWTRKPTEGKA
jgi:hypothetical protein